MARRIKHSFKIKENAIIEKSVQGIRVNTYFFGKDGDKYCLEYVRMYPYPKTIRQELDKDISNEVGWWLGSLKAGAEYYTTDEKFVDFIVGLGIAERGVSYV